MTIDTDHNNSVGVSPAVEKHTRLILIVDDDEDARRLARAAVRNAMRGKVEEVEISFAEDGEIACKAIEQHLPALILLDLMMPKMSGWAVLRRLNESPSLRRISVILVSAVDPSEAMLLKGVHKQIRAVVRKGGGAEPIQTAVMDALGFRNEGQNGTATKSI